MKSSHQADNLPQLPDASVAIIQSKWHRELSDKMVARCQETLQRAGISNSRVHLLPGALELPFAAQELARSAPKPDAIIAFGIILKGETDHYETVRDECNRGLSAVALEESVPILNAVLPVHTIKHAEDRCADNEFNKGIEAALAAIEMIAWRRSIC